MEELYLKRSENVDKVLLALTMKIQYLQLHKLWAWTLDFISKQRKFAEVVKLRGINQTNEKGKRGRMGVSGKTKNQALSLLLVIERMKLAFWCISNKERFLGHLCW